jgi:hypothetical protein
MEFLQIFIIFVIVSTVAGFSVTFPLDNEVLGSQCNNEAGEIGVHKLQNQCKGNVMGYIKFVGAVVCCVETPKFTAQSYCSKFGSKASDFLHYNLVTLEFSFNQTP